ncbi:MAG TPA: hypothetical protein VEY10_06710 [Flavisolibacter sp.]|nr:hypothetical protein [Flavisolibacter sp.]
MRMLASSCLALFALLFLISCQKEADFTDPAQGGTGNGGNGTNPATSYYPLTKGSWWKYKDSLTGTTTSGTATNVTKSINGITYTAVVATGGSQIDTSWIASPQPNYYITVHGNSPNTGAGFNIVFHYLNDTAAVGHNWEYNAGQGNGFTAIVKTTIVERNLSMTVTGKHFKNVIHTRLDLKYDMLGFIMEAGTYDYFIAKGVGIIKVRTQLLNFGVPVLQSCADLTDHSIK